MKLNNELLPGFKKYVDDIYEYVITCYELLPENEKVDFLNLKEKYEKIQKQVIFILRSKDSLKNATMVKCLELFPEIQVYFHDFGKDKEMTARRMYVDSEKLPLMVITEGPCQGIFAAAGYSVGMADMLMRIFEA